MKIYRAYQSEAYEPDCVIGYFKNKVDAELALEACKKESLADGYWYYSYEIETIDVQ